MGNAGAASPDAVCPRCDRLNRMAAGYCGGCGLELPGERPCPACGAPNPKRHQYCDMCGGAMLARDSSHLPARPAPVRTRAGLTPDAAPAKPLDPRRDAMPRSLTASLPGAWPYAAVLAAAAVLPRLYRVDSLLPAGLGAATVGLFYLLAHRLLGPRPALLASIILAVSLWHIQLSRLVLPTMLPSLLMAASDPGAAVEQIAAYSITASQEYQDLQGIPEQTRYLASSVARAAARVFFGALGGGETLLDAITGLLALMGLLACAARWRERSHALLLALFGAGVVLAGLTTGEGLHARMAVALPAAIAAAGFGLHWTMTWMKGRLSDRAVYGFAVVVIVLVAYVNLSSYFGAAQG